MLFPGKSSELNDGLGAISAPPLTSPQASAATNSSTEPTGGVSSRPKISSRRAPGPNNKHNKRIRHSAKFAMHMLDNLAQGARLVLETSRIESNVKVAIDNMVARGLVPEDAHAYYDNTLRASPSVGHGQRDIKHNPLPEHLVHARHKIQTALGAEGTSAVYLLGAGNESAESEKTAFRQSGLVIAVPGGVRTARQMLHYAVQRYSDPDMPPIIIENTDRFWDPLLKTAGVMDRAGNTIVADAQQARHLGIHVTQSRQETLAVARKIMAVNDIKPADYPKVEPMLPPGAVLFFATSTVKKCRELQAACKAQGYDIQIRPIDQLVDFFLSPDEDRNTYQGNAAAKVEAALASWQKMPAAAQDQALQRLGLKREQCFFAIEDSGVWFKERKLQQEPEFSSIRHLLPEDANFPGVETGPTIWGGGGVPEFVAKARQAILRRAQLREEKPNLGVDSVSLMAMVPLKPDAAGKHPVTMTFAHRAMTIAQEADSYDAKEQKNYDLCDFLYPMHSSVTERQSTTWVKLAGPRAGAMRALAVIGQAKKTEHPPEISPMLDFQAGLYVPEQRQPQIQQYFRSSQRQLTAWVQPYPQIETLGDVQHKLFAPHDAVALAFDNPKDPGDYARRFITYGYVFFSAMVAQQTRDKYMLGKMFAVLDDKKQSGDDKILDRLVAMTYDLHRQGAIPQEPRTLFQRFDNVTELGRAMNAAKKEMFRYAPFSYSSGPDIIQQSGIASSKNYHAALLLTASLKGTAIIDVAQRMTEALAAHDIGIVTGAGLNNGGMGAVTHTAHDLAARGVNVHHTGITTPHIRDFEGSGNIEKMVQRFVLTKDIYGRMDWLNRADSSVELPGGAGTLQEKFAKLLMIMVARENGAPGLEPFRHSQIVVMNTPVPENGHVRGFFDVTMKQFPKQILTDYPIHVVNSVNGAMDTILAHRATQQAAGRSTSFRPE